MNAAETLGVIRTSAELSTDLWPVTLVAVACAIAGLRALWVSGHLWRWQTALVAVALVLALVVVPIYTVTFWADPGIDTPESQETPVYILGAIWASFFAVLASAIVCARNFRVPLAGISLLVAWLGIGVMFVSSMAVSGLWL